MSVLQLKKQPKLLKTMLLTYDVVVAKGTTQETLVYDSTGKFLKKMEAKAGMVKPGQKLQQSRLQRISNNQQTV